MKIDIKEFSRRRRQLMRMAGRDAIVIVPSAPEQLRNNDAHYPYRQDSDFHYLTGFGEPDSVLALVPGRAQGEVILFCRERDRTREQWDGTERDRKERSMISAWTMRFPSRISTTFFLA